jgi:Spy/CpxP family protein refolding chaperone
MRPTRWLNLAALAAAVLMLQTAPAFADPPGGPGGPGGGGMEGRLEYKLSKLGLQPDQQQKIQAILDAAKPQRQQLRTQMHKAFDDMKVLLDQDTPDQNAVLAQADLIGQLTTEAHKGMLTTLLAVRAELTPDQRLKLKESMRGRGGRFRRWHQNPNGGQNGSQTPPPPADPNSGT